MFVLKLDFLLALCFAFCHYCRAVTVIYSPGPMASCPSSEIASSWFVHLALEFGTFGNDSHRLPLRLRNFCRETRSCAPLSRQPARMLLAEPGRYCARAASAHRFSLPARHRPCVQANGKRLGCPHRFRCNASQTDGANRDA